VAVNRIDADFVGFLGDACEWSWIWITRGEKVRNQISWRISEGRRGKNANDRVWSAGVRIGVRACVVTVFSANGLAICEDKVAVGLLE
jgi:hypothetical protein